MLVQHEPALVALVSAALAFGAVACEVSGEGPIGVSSSDAGTRIPASPTVGSDGPMDAQPKSPAPAPTDASADAPMGCDAKVDAVTIVPSTHVPEDSTIAYVSNPPSSGPHYPRWANFQEYTTPVADGFLVHSMEHGAVVLFYKCSSAAECPDVASGLRAVRDAAETDPVCTPAMRVRVVLVPKPDLEVPVAAAAWGFIYRATCVDAVSLGAFIRDHYAKAPEDTCAVNATF